MKDIASNDLKTNILILFVLILFVLLGVAALFYLFLPQFTSNVTADPIPTRLDVHLVTISASGDLWAHTSEGTIRVTVIFDNQVETPFIEATKTVEKRKYPQKEKTWIAWSKGGKLFIKNKEQLESLLLR